MSDATASNEKIQILDSHYFAFSALFTVGLQLSFFTVAFLCKFDLITDFAAALNKCILAILTLVFNGTFYTRQIVLTTFLLVCRAELGLFLLYRVCSRKKDNRFDELRENFFAFLGFWVYQMVWVFTTIAPVIFVNGDDSNPPLNAWDYVGWTVYSIGFLAQVVADYQKFQFRKNPDNKGVICQVGIWKYSRHPNYFGEIMLWSGIFIGAIPIITSANNSNGLGWLTIISPVFSIFVLLFVSGLPFAEGPNLKRWYELPDKGANWEQYAKTTAPLIPTPRFVYTRLSSVVKKIFCCEYDMYKYKVESNGLIDNGKSSVAKPNPSYGSSEE
jgi:steroid 5-alpha reductase family enzyme